MKASEADISKMQIMRSPADRSRYGDQVCLGFLTNQFHREPGKKKRHIQF